MNILANENLYDPIVHFLIREGHDVLDTKRTALAGAPDEEVFQRAIRDQRVIVTMDKDFTRMLRFPPDRCGGIIVVKLYRLKVDDATALFARQFRALGEQAIRGKLIILTRDAVRIRTPRHV